MDKKSKILLTILVILTIASVGYTFYISEDTFEDASEAEME